MNSLWLISASVRVIDIMIAILVGLLVANITVLLFFYFFFLIIFKFLFFPVPVLKRSTKLRLALAIATGAPMTVANEVI